MKRIILIMLSITICLAVFVGCSNTESDNELQPANANNSTLPTDDNEKVPGEYEITIQYENRRYGYTSGQNDDVKARYSLGENIPTNFTRTVEDSDIVSINETFDKQSLISGKIIPCNDNVLIVSANNGAYYYFELIVAGGVNN